MKVLIGVLTCHARAATHVSIQRATWLPTLPPHGVDCVFFYGSGSHGVNLRDEITLEVDDSYEGMCSKARRVYRFAEELGYDYLFTCGDDTWVAPVRLLKSGYYKYNLIGRTRGVAGEYPDDYPSGGAGTMISRRSLEYLNAAPPTDDPCEDRWLGGVLRSHKIICHRDPRYSLAREVHMKDFNALITCETTRHGRPEPEADMYRIHKLAKGGL